MVNISATVIYCSLSTASGNMWTAISESHKEVKCRAQKQANW